MKKHHTINRAPRLLWANLHCLVDTSSGASMSVRQMLKQLKSNGFDIDVVGATIFDSENGKTLLEPHWDAIIDKNNNAIEVTDGELLHRLIITNSYDRSLINSKEINHWHRLYLERLSIFKPDLVWFYGGDAISSLVPHEARIRGIPSVSYTPNGSYTSLNWCRDVDLILTDSDATAEYYNNLHGVFPKSVGKFIDRATVVASHNIRKNVTFINPSLQKGVVVVIQLALALAKKRPDIKFEIVESRGDWNHLVTLVCDMLGEDPASLSNVAITPNQSDMRRVYARSRVLLAPSFWWESGARVLVEAMMNGIPAIVSNRGGNMEMVQDAGISIEFPSACYEPPYDKFPKPELLAPVIERIERLYDDQEYYEIMSKKAIEVAEKKHSIEQSTKRLIEALNPLIERQAGNLDHRSILKSYHKQSCDPDRIRFVSGSRTDSLKVPLQPGKKGIFLDCGGYDGCSAIKFINENPNFVSISFEPNPAMWSYYDTVPTILVKKAAYIFDGEIDLIIDEVDGDGSTIVKTKKVDYWNSVSNEKCPIIRVKTVDIIKILAKFKSLYDIIVLKLDIEGAEYDVLENMLNHDLVRHIDRIYAEFHWKKCGFSEARHLQLMNKITSLTKVYDWDALDYAVHQKPSEEKVRRDRIVQFNLGSLEKYKSVAL